MKKCLILIISFLCAGEAFSQKDSYFPQVFFDKKQAEAQLGAGKSTIEGVAFTREKRSIPLTMGAVKVKTGKKHMARPNTVVMLFPVTEYFTEFYNLRKKLESKTKQVLMSNEAFAVRREAYTDNYGRFRFENLKVGKYYLETIVDFTAVGSYKQQTGTSTAYNVYGTPLYSTPIYETFFYDYEAAHRESKFVEVKKDGQVIEIKL
ncbi:MAG: carboxypeptidase regulatory-like domain-containing protein [Flavobacteriaceae bacterium]|nr:carboxypeptidase regulatory-like domain-containing protein [Flavobacteriaceae bacterium]